MAARGKSRNEGVFADQGGVSTMDPAAPLRYMSSKVMTRMADLERRERRRASIEARRRKAGDPHVVEYFHQVDDAYSQLAVQLLEPLRERYDVKLRVHLVHAPEGRNAPEPELLLDLAVRDAAAIAPHYGLEFPAATRRPAAEEVTLAQRALAELEADAFPAAARELGARLFSAADELSEAGLNMPLATGREATALMDRGTLRRSRLKHYSGAMFYYGGEWYWGVDRLYHLEQRLQALGLARASGMVAPRPPIELGPARDSGTLTLEFYPSLRSPYTSMIFDKTLELAEHTGVRLEMRPVLPMVMRGVPATREKGGYIMADAAREAAALGLRWGRIYDPIGEPVRQAYSLYPWAVEQGRGTELLQAFLHAAFFEGVNTNNQRGLRRVVEQAGLPWAEAKERLGDPAWEALIERNRQAMYGFGCWGVPSYRLLDAQGNTRLALWGQDRLWLVSREIQRCLEAA